jgi:hypothetical protein
MCTQLCFNKKLFLALTLTLTLALTQTSCLAPHTTPKPSELGDVLSLLMNGEVATVE